MAQRSYEQFCPLAYTLDLVGERWTLLIVRDLMSGPKRYSDLSRGLPALATDLLTDRLRKLERAGAVRRRELGPPASATAYELTERGRELLPAVLALARFGVGLLVADSDRKASPNPDHFGLLLEVLFDPTGAPVEPETWAFETDAGTMAVTVGRDAFEVTPVDERPENASARFAADVPTIIEWVFGKLDTRAALADGRLKVEGGPGVLERMRAAFPAPSYA
jgi:DNA-binding HxlR family transcriptional regulator